MSTAKEVPPLRVPSGSEICKISIINSTTNITVPPSYLVEPDIKGHNWLNLPTYSFHITHERTGKQIVFDLGCRKDWWNSVPQIVDLCKNHVTGLEIEKDVHEILTEGGVDINEVSAVILSHWHFDHTGDPAVLPKSINLIVGPGFKETFLPGWPSKEDSPFHEAEFEGREVVEISFDDKFKIGKFQAFDYFGDGSLYILNVPGHATGHISALVRTTPDSFIFLGGDVCHFTGMLRPTEYVSMPDTIPTGTFLDRHLPQPCPCAAFTVCHPNQDKSRTSPFYKPSTAEGSFYADPPLAQTSINALAEFDADPNVLVIVAHDIAPLDILPFFPKFTLNDWRSKDYKEAMHWAFVNELPYEGEARRPQLTDGLYREGKRLRTLTEKMT